MTFQENDFREMGSIEKAFEENGGALHKNVFGKLELPVFPYWAAIWARVPVL